MRQYFIFMLLIGGPKVVRCPDFLELKIGFWNSPLYWESPQIFISQLPKDCDSPENWLSIELLIKSPLLLASDKTLAKAMLHIHNIIYVSYLQPTLICIFTLQWNHSTLSILGTEGSSLISEVSCLRCGIYLGGKRYCNYDYVVQNCHLIKEVWGNLQDDSGALVPWGYKGFNLFWLYQSWRYTGMQFSRNLETSLIWNEAQSVYPHST